MVQACIWCGKPLGAEALPFTCRYCKKTFCAEHRLPPNHSCSGIAEWMGRAQSPIFARTGIPVSSQHDTEVEMPIRSEPRGTRPVEERGRPSRHFPYKRVIALCLIVILVFSYVQFPYIWEKPVTTAWTWLKDLAPAIRRAVTKTETVTEAITGPAITISTTLTTTVTTTVSPITTTKTYTVTLTPTSQLRDVAIREVLNELNTARQTVGLSNVSLVGSPVAASYRAGDMLNNQYFGHYDLSGYHPDYHYTRLGGLYVVEENLGYVFSSELNSADVPECSRKLVYVMIYRDESSDWRHRNSLLDPTNNYVDISVTWDKTKLILVIHMLKIWVNWITPPKFENGEFTCSGKLRLSSSSIQVVYVCYSNPTDHIKRNELSYSIGNPVVGIAPEPYYYLGMETIRPKVWVTDGQAFNISFNLKALKGSGLYTIVLSAKNTIQYEHPYDSRRYKNELPVLEFVVNLS